MNYGSAAVRYSRSIEYAHLPNQDYDVRRLRPLRTVVVHETSSSEGEPFYPVPSPRNTALYDRYRAMADRLQRSRRKRCPCRYRTVRDPDSEMCDLAEFGIRDGHW